MAGVRGSRLENACTTHFFSFPFLFLLLLLFLRLESPTEEENCAVQCSHQCGDPGCDAGTSFLVLLPGRLVTDTHLLPRSELFPIPTSLCLQRSHARHAPSHAEMSGQPGDASAGIKLESLSGLGMWNLLVHADHRPSTPARAPLRRRLKDTAPDPGKWARESGADVQKCRQLLTYLPHTRQETPWSFREVGRSRRRESWRGLDGSRSSGPQSCGGPEFGY